MTSPPSRPTLAPDFAEALTGHQSRLYAFVYSQLADPELAQDVLQETNRVLWETAGEYDPARAFLPWAFAVAKNQVRAARKRHSRERLAFDPDVAEQLAARVAQRSTERGGRQAALAHCVEQLPLRQRQLLQRRYSLGETLQEVASALGRTASAVGVMLFRSRQTLAACIEHKLSGVET